MDKNFKLNESKKLLVGNIKFLLMALLIIIEIIICAQYAPSYDSHTQRGYLLAVIICCVALAILEAIDAFVIKNLIAKYVFFALESVCMLALCVFTGNTYLSTLNCLILTQIYISVDRLRDDIIVFSVSCALFIVSFVSGRIFTGSAETVFQKIVEILSNSIWGLVVLAVHFMVTNFVLSSYSKNQQLRKALQEADDSKTRLEEAYKELSRTAVYEERNRIAKDIHDNAGHSMTTVIMQTEAAKLLIDADPQKAKTHIISANIQAKNALEQMRESVHLLAGRAHIVTLKEEIEEIIAQTADGTELKIRSNLDEVSLSDEGARFLCNSIKECLVNGIRHGRATAFFIEMKSQNDKISLLVSDNGCGVKDTVNEGFGLKGIKQKAESLGGECRFVSETDEGFETMITIPVTEKKEVKND